MAHPPYEPYYLAAPPQEYNYAAADRNGINTLFVSGLPDDVKAREIHNLFRRPHGFESCQLKYTGRCNQWHLRLCESPIGNGSSAFFEYGDSDGGNQDSSAAEKSEQTCHGNDAFAPESEQAEKAADGACSTLFIANLGATCTEDELKQLLSQYQGFNSLKVHARGGMPVAFADFEGVEHATDAMYTLQGSTLPSSDLGGMHIREDEMRKP